MTNKNEKTDSGLQERMNDFVFLVTKKDGKEMIISNPAPRKQSEEKPKKS